MVTVDVMDVSGDNQDDVQDDVYKQRLDQQGNNITGQAAVRLGAFVNALCLFPSFLGFVLNISVYLFIHSSSRL